MYLRINAYICLAFGRDLCGTYICFDDGTHVDMNWYWHCACYVIYIGKTLMISDPTNIEVNSEIRH